MRMLDKWCRKIISGGQTGADRAALDFAAKWQIDSGGWCPRGRLAEDGPLPLYYPLRCTESAEYPERTRLNVRDSNATVIFTTGDYLKGGSYLTYAECSKQRKPVIHMNPRRVIATLDRFLEEHKPEVLNIAGTRASKDPEVYDFVMRSLTSYANFNLQTYEEDIP